jgi:L-alanine-DL-glutamate epimerase-like enolase superfamily enzyme
MRIRALGADRISIPFRRPFPTASGMWLRRDAWLLRLLDDDGRVGLGEAVLETSGDEVGERILALLVREAVELAADGRLPTITDLELHGAPGRALAAALGAARLDLSRPGPTAAAAAADPGVGVNAVITFGGADAGGEAARQSVSAGFRTLKIKAGTERETDVLLARVRAVRAAVGPEVRLRIDANGAWDLDTAEERLGAIARFDLEYAEQPLAGHDVDGLASLRRRVDVPIAADEAVESVAAARTLLRAEAADVLVVKPARVGGPDAAAEIAAFAAERGVPVVISTLFETGVGIAAALASAAALPGTTMPGQAEPPDHGLATAGLLDHDLLLASLVVAGGRMRAPGGPGTGALGIALDDRAVARFRSEAGAGASTEAGAGASVGAEDPPSPFSS